MCILTYEEKKVEQCCFFICVTFKIAFNLLYKNDYSLCIIH